MKQGKTKATYYIAAVGLAALAMSGAAMAGIQGSVHDFSAKTFTGGDGTLGTGEICVTCHTPHNNTSGETLLWNHTLNTTPNAYTPYASPSLDAGTLGQPTGVAKLCLSCHDGTLAIDSFGGTQGGVDGNKTISELIPTTSADLGTDLSNDHPISFNYDTAYTNEGGANSGLVASTTAGIQIGDGTDKTKTGTLAEVMLSGGDVQCSSCHDVHNNYITASGFLLKRSMAGSTLCLTCHDK